MSEGADYELHKRVERIENCLFGDPSDKYDKGMRDDLRDLVGLAHSGNIAVRVIMWFGGGIASLWAAWDWIIAHFPRG